MSPKTHSSRPAAARRQATIERLAADESEAWAEFLFAQLHSEGRLIEGGWPGTISEARRRLMNRLATHPEAPPPDRGELDRMVDLIYSQAKQRWLLASRS